ncbi:glutathione hydrolase 1 proenzyme isoform X2 [Eurytemora carolleeae]|uniref:glutathione hydrolase 1 proenzyme isoform X2 n=1 Tax=Eurytemora carolleeae TaxID=1294199 RepID=UPI000C764104|nr:glutathione hydrolase 1 proenzyme isoform X2 [Eurytemora carolleeae]|eukprot:XP_023321317.1 glutathione hydrolase 1 proenzyme-like isoform X2 [Eurytemora affinis]
MEKNVFGSRYGTIEDFPLSEKRRPVCSLLCKCMMGAAALCLIIIGLIIIARERNYEEKMVLTLVDINVDTGPNIDVVLAVDNSQNQPEYDQGGLENQPEYDQGGLENQPEYDRGGLENAAEYGILFPKETSNSVAKKFKKAVVASDGSPCATVGSQLLEEGGTAVDAAVAALLCNGVYSSQSMGIGGGFLMTIYDAESGEVVSLNSRESAPAFSSKDMFGSNSTLALKGPLAVAVPGEIDGYYQARERYGNKSISWRRILQPTIDMCRNGIPVSWSMANTISDFDFTDPTLRSTFTNPSTGVPYKEGDMYKREALANTLDRLAAAGSGIRDEFYQGEVGRLLVQDLQKLGGKLTMADMAAYSSVWSPTVQTVLKSVNLTVHSAPPPGSGAVLGAILNIMDQFPDHQDDVLFYHRLTEAFKFAYGVRSSLGDPQDNEITDLVNSLVNNITSEAWARSVYRKINDRQTYNDLEYYGAEFSMVPDKGTAHLTVLAENGDAVSVTSTVNTNFGCELMSPSTGIIYNNEMNDFSFPFFSNDFNLPPSPSNYVKPGKRPQSSMCPAIILDNQGKVRLLIGGAGGTRITTGVAQTLASHIWLKKSIQESIDHPRLHHQLAPNQLEYQTEFNKDILAGLIEKGHQLKDRGTAGSILTAVHIENGGFLGVSDYRKAGGVDGY